MGLKATNPSRMGQGLADRPKPADHRGYHIHYLGTTTSKHIHHLLIQQMAQPRGHMPPMYKFPYFTGVSAHSTIVTTLP